MPTNLEDHSYLDAADYAESSAPVAAAASAMPTPAQEGYHSNANLRSNWPGLSQPDSIRQAYTAGATKIARFLPLSNSPNPNQLTPPPTGSDNTVYATPANGGSGPATLRALVAADIPTLNQNTTGTAGGLTGTPAITVAAVTCTSIACTTVSGSSFFACNGATAVAPDTGYGTPTGNALTASFAASSITLPQLAAEVAQLIIDLKATGLIKA